jgi:SPP1 gp7 family putative phage head morphogenesis protein
LAIERQAAKTAVEAVKQAIEGQVADSSLVEKAFLTGNAALGNTGLGGAATMLSARSGQGQQPGTSWSNQGGLQNALIARVTQNLSSGFARAPEELELALAEQGLSWGPPFPPGRPLDPFWGYRRPARTWDYTVGENVQLTPRWGRVSFQTLKAIYDAYDVAQVCTRHLINDVRSLDYNWEPIPGIKADVSGDIEEAIAFFDSPDKRQPFRSWLAEYLQDVLRYDAGSLYIRRSEAGDPLAWEVISGTTIIPLIDFYGRRPEDETDTETPEDLFEGEIVPAYVQIINGLPWDWLASDDLIYQPWNPLPESQYGLAPLEAVLLSANTDVRFQWHFLQFFTEGTIPAGFMEAPPDQSDPAQIAHWQETWDAIMQGDQGKLRQIRWVPNGSKFTEAKPSSNKFDELFPLYLMRRTCAAFGVTPNDLGFTESVNRATGDTQIDVQFRVGTSPLLRHVEDTINLFVKQHLKLRCRINFDDGKETEDRVATATADKIYVESGVKGVDEVRQSLGLHVDKSRPMPRFINNTRSGPIPLLALESMAGEIDPETYGPSDAQKPVSTPFSPPPGAIPPAGSPEAIAAAEHTAQSARDLVEATVGETPATDPSLKPAAAPAKGEDETTEAEGGEEGEAEKGWQDVLAVLDEIEKAQEPRITALLQGSYGGYGCGQIWVNKAKKRVLINFGDGESDVVDEVRVLASKEWPEYEIESDAEVGFPGEGWDLSPLSAAPPTKQEAAKAQDNTGGPGITRGFSNSTTITGGTDGITVPTGIQGEDLLDEDEDDEDDAVKAAYVALTLRRWRDNSRSRLRKGRPPRKFVDPNLSQALHDEVWARLSKATTRAEVDAAFADVGKKASAGSSRPAFHSQADRIVGHYGPLIAEALGGMFNQQAIDDALRAAYDAGSVEKHKSPADGSSDPEDGSTAVEHPVGAQEDDGGASGDSVGHAVKSTGPPHQQAIDDAVRAAYNTDSAQKQAEGTHGTEDHRDEVYEGDPSPEGHTAKSTGQVEKGVRSGMVSLDLPPGIVDCANPHITIVFIGSDVDDATFAAVCDKAREVANGMAPLEGTIGGRGTFSPSEASDGKTPVYAIPKVDGLDDLRAPFESFNASEHKDFHPHMTLAYVAEGELFPDPVPQTKVAFDGLSVHRGDTVVKFPFGGGPPPNLRPAENSLARCRNCCLFAHPVCVKYGNWPVEPDQTCDGWELAIDDQVEKADATTTVAAAVAAAVKVLRDRVQTAELAPVLRALYGDSFLQGAHDAAEAAHGQVVVSLRGFTGMPADYWDAWKPGWGEAAAQAADGGMRELLDKADITIQGLSDSTIDDLGNKIAAGLQGGASMESVGKELRGVLESPARAETVANTEMARATSAASEATYAENGVEQVTWLAEADACPECEDLADQSPLGLGDASPPQHPNCRCAIAPVVDLGGGEGTEG